ncbi:MAG: hypothetical protein EBS23_10355, partial [Betaproteobacteria bacterium]|nr:hypothetical protein [Betaproteobacteria bacterium]
LELTAARLDASGDAGGGSIYIGGGWQGASIDGRLSALTTRISADSVLNASALHTGNGGTIVAWSDIHNPESNTTVSGTLTAQGGAQAGDGGRIETSGALVDIATARINASAPRGSGGLWLIDPYDYTIDSAAAGAISGSLGGGTSVTVTTAVQNTTLGASAADSVPGGSGNGDITVTASISKTAGPGLDATLTLKAHRRVTVATGSGISSTSGKLNVVLWSDFDGTQDGGVAIDAPISTNGGHLWAGGTASGGGSSTWNGLTVGNGPSVGHQSANHNAFDLSSSINTAGGHTLLWAGTGNNSQNGIGIKKSASLIDPSINTGSGNLTLIARSLYNWDGSNATLGVSTTGTLTLAPDTASAWSSFNW